MSSRPSERDRPAGRPVKTPKLDSGERRSWLSNGLLALAISALGIVVAGSMTLTTNAQSTEESALPRVQVSSSAASATEPGSGSTPPGASPAVTGQQSLQAFSPPRDRSADTNQQVRAAVVTERAAQRAEDLSKTAEDVTRSALRANGQVRAQDLAAADRSIQQTAARLAAERIQRAIAARVAAENARKLAEAAAAAAATNTNASTSNTSANVDLSSIPTGGGGVSPVPGAVIGTPFGATGIWARYHTGLDFRAAEGTPIRAVKAGVVLYAGNSGNWAGNHVAVRHSGGYTTMSSHMSSIAVQVGQSVQAGQVIGYVGHTGRAFGAHLHFEVYPPGSSTETSIGPSIRCRGCGQRSAYPVTLRHTTCSGGYPLFLLVVIHPLWFSQSTAQYR